MNIVEPYARLMDVPDQESGIKLLKKIEWCARISHRSEDACTDDSWQKIIKAVVMDHGDWSVVEHASVSVDMLVDRGITHEIVRHRLFSYTQESTRFVNYDKKDGHGAYKNPATFVHPKIEPRDVRGSREDLSINQKNEQAQAAWAAAVSEREHRYRELITLGVAPQIARSVFPNALSSRIVVTGNLRNWRHFFIMRTTQEAHPQMRQVTIPLLAEFKAKIPMLFDDIEPMAKQSEGMKKAR